MKLGYQCENNNHKECGGRWIENPDRPGGFGGRIALDEASGTITRSGGSAENTGAFVGGGAGHSICDLTGCTERGGSGQHPQGPGGNSGNAPPP